MTVGTDSASMGPCPMASDALRRPETWHDLDGKRHEPRRVPCYRCLLLHAGPDARTARTGPRASFPIVGGELPRRLIESADKRAIDLSPTLAANFPLTAPGIGTGQHRQTYLKIDFLYSDYLDLWHHTHLMDSMAGTHLVPPSFACPPGVKPTSPRFACGWRSTKRSMVRAARPCSRPSKCRSTGPAARRTSSTCDRWSAAPRRATGQPRPRYYRQHVQAYEQHGDLKAGDVVLFHTGHLDKHLRPQPNAAGVWSNPLLGKSEGWPAPGPDTIVYLKSKGIRCVATNAPTWGAWIPSVH